MKTILAILLVLFLLTGCQSMKYHSKKYNDKGQLIEEVQLEKEGVPDWSDGKSLEFHGHAAG